MAKKEQQKKKSEEVETEKGALSFAELDFGEHLKPLGPLWVSLSPIEKKKPEEAKKPKTVRVLDATVLPMPHRPQGDAGEARSGESLKEQEDKLQEQYGQSRMKARTVLMARKHPSQKKKAPQSIGSMIPGKG